MSGADMAKLRAKLGHIMPAQTIKPTIPTNFAPHGEKRETFDEFVQSQKEWLNRFCDGENEPRKGYDMAKVLPQTNEEAVFFLTCTVLGRPSSCHGLVHTAYSARRVLHLLCLVVNDDISS